MNLLNKIIFMVFIFLNIRKYYWFFCSMKLIFYFREKWYYYSDMFKDVELKYVKKVFNLDLILIFGFVNY